MRIKKIAVSALLTTLLPFASFAQWGLNGNSISSSQFLGTTNNQPFLIKRNNTTIFNSDIYSNIGIGLNANFDSYDSYSFGKNNTTTLQYRSMVIGFDIDNYDDGGYSQDNFSIGQFIFNSGYGNYILGRGLDINNRLSSPSPGLSIGFNSTIPTFYVGQSSGVNTTGNVGIATTSPAYKLDVSGTFRTTDNSYLMGNVGVGTTSPTYKLDVNGIFRTTGNGYLMGNVGVGTTTPENAEGWDKVLNVNGLNHSKIIATTTSGAIQTGIWSHSVGFYGAPIGGFTGTSSNHSFSIITNSATRLTINNLGNVGIGTTCIPTGYKLAVKGKIICEEVMVKLEGGNCWADYVFNKDYNLMTLSELEKFIIINKHLPNIPKASEIEQNGLSVNEILTKQMEKIEELTLYVIELKKELDQVKNQNNINDCETKY